MILNDPAFPSPILLTLSNLNPSKGSLLPSELEIFPEGFPETGAQLTLEKELLSASTEK